MPNKKKTAGKREKEKKVHDMLFLVIQAFFFLFHSETDEISRSLKKKVFLNRSLEKK
jgi:hypothetical protein